MRNFFQSPAGTILFILGIIILILLILISLLIRFLKQYTNPADKILQAAGIVEKQIELGQHRFNYAEGPDRGPALLLLHAQMLDWYTYHRVLPELSKKFHVFALDYPGHGKTTSPTDYPMTGNQIGADLAEFIQTVIGEPVYATGNSSGGLLTAWLAANQPDLVKAIILEDPPLFSAEYPEIKNTIAYLGFTTSHQAVQEGYQDNFLDYWIANSAQFFKTYAGPLVQPLVKFIVGSYKSANPGKPVEIAFLPLTVQEIIRGLDYYDPRFGSSFYQGTWNVDFDHAKTLSKIECPALLLHANYKIDKNGILHGAMTANQAERAASLLKYGRLLKVDSSHVINLEAPDIFIQLLEEFFLQS